MRRPSVPTDLASTFAKASDFAKASSDKSENKSEARSRVSLTSVMFELIDDDGADDDAAFDDLLPVSGNVGQVEDVI